jgi:hypothetical protein
VTSNFGEINGAWFVRTNGGRLNLRIDTTDHADPKWRAKQAAKSEEDAITQYLKTISDDLAERIFEWGKENASKSSE